jgi:hypothetical protein
MGGENQKKELPALIQQRFQIVLMLKPNQFKRKQLLFQ